MAFFEMVDDRVFIDFQYPGSISNSAAIVCHLFDFIGNTWLIGLVGIAHLEGSSAGFAFQALMSMLLPCFDQIFTLTIPTFDCFKDHFVFRGI